MVQVDDKSSIITSTTIHDIKRNENLVTFERHIDNTNSDNNFISQIDHPASKYDYSPKMRRRLEMMITIIDKIMTHCNMYYVRTWVVEKFFTKVI